MNSIKKWLIALAVHSLLIVGCYAVKSKSGRGGKKHKRSTNSSSKQENSHGKKRQRTAAGSSSMIAQAGAGGPGAGGQEAQKKECVICRDDMSLSGEDKWAEADWRLPCDHEQEMHYDCFDRWAKWCPLCKRVSESVAAFRRSFSQAAEDDLELSLRNLAVHPFATRVVIDGKTLLEWSENNGYAMAVKILKKGIRNPEREKIFTAAINDSVSDLRLCLERGVDIDVQDDNGYTALMYALYYTNVKATQFLLQRGANVALFNSKGNAALHMVIPFGNPFLVHLLVGAGANVNQKNARGVTPIFMACGQNDAGAGAPDIVKTLLESGAFVNAKNSEGDAPLHVACRYGLREVVQELMQKGADMHEKNNEGENAILIDRCNGNKVTRILMMKQRELLDYYMNLCEFTQCYQVVFWMSSDALCLPGSLGETALERIVRHSDANNHCKLLFEEILKKAGEGWSFDHALQIARQSGNEYFVRCLSAAKERFSDRTESESSVLHNLWMQAKGLFGY